MFTDIVGFTALTQSDEAHSLQVLERHNRVLKPIFPKFRGREVKAMGDSFLVEFDSALDATTCAMEIQTFLHDYNISTRDEWKITLRIGIHLGDVVHKDGDVFGDAVNIASRLQPLAEPEGICVSDQVYGQVRNKIPQSLVKLEPRELKGVRFPVDVYRVIMPWEKAAPAVTTGPAFTSPDRTRVAVLPLTNLSSNPEDGYFADGMTEEIITALSHVKELRVIARTSVMGYKGTTKKAEEIGAELGAGSILEGSVRKAGNRVRITAQLIAAITGDHMWAENYDRTLEDVFAIQSDIAEKVAGQLKVMLLGSEKQVIGRKPTENTEAYILFLQGREKLREQTKTSLNSAVELFKKATELDPSFAGAHNGIADCYRLLANDGYMTQEQALPRAELSVRKALDLDPGLAEAHATLAHIYFAEDHDFDCELEAKRALELNPSGPEAIEMIAHVALLQGNLDEGIRLFEAAYSLDPLRQWYAERLGLLYFYSGKGEKATEFWEKTSQFAPAGTYRNMTEYYITKGNYAKAKEIHSMAKRLDPTHSWLPWMEGFIAARTGDRERAFELIKKAEENWTDDSLNVIAFIYYALGDMNAYFTYMKRASEQHVFRYIYYMYSPLFAEGRENPRYQEIMETEGWGGHERPK